MHVKELTRGGEIIKLSPPFVAEIKTVALILKRVEKENKDGND